MGRNNPKARFAVRMVRTTERFDNQVDGIDVASDLMENQTAKGYGRPESYSHNSPYEPAGSTSYSTVHDRSVGIEAHTL